MKTSKLLITSLLAAAAMSVPAYAADVGGATESITGTTATVSGTYTYNSSTATGYAPTDPSVTKVVFNGFTGLLAPWAGGVFAYDIELTNNGTTAAYTVNNGSSDGYIAFSGALTGTGTFTTYSGNPGKYSDWVFTGNIQGFNGVFNLSNATMNTGDKGIGASVSSEGILQFGGKVNSSSFTDEATSYSSSATVGDDGIVHNISGTNQSRISTASVLRYNYKGGANGQTLGIDNASISARYLEFKGGANYTVSSTLTGNNTAANNTLKISAGTAAFTGSIANFGTITVANGATADFSNTTFKLGAVRADSVTTTISNSGTVTFGAGTVFDINSYVAGAQLLGGVSTPPSFTIANLSIGGYLANQRGSATFSVSDAGVLTLDSYEEGAKYSLTWNGGVSGVWKANGSGWTTTGTADEVTFQNGDYVTFGTGTDNNVKLAENLKVGTMTVSAATNLTGTGTVRVDAANLTTTAALTLGENVILDLGSISAATTKTISGTGTVKVVSSSTNNDGTPNHNGTLTLGSDFSGTIEYSGKFNTSNGNGTNNPNAKFALSNGSMWGGNTIANDIHFLTNYQLGDTTATTIVLNGNLTQEAGTTLTIGTNANTNITFGGSATLGKLAVSGGTLNLRGTATGTTTLAANAGTVNIGSGWTLSSTAQIGGTVNIGDGGVWEIIGQDNGSSRITGTVNINAGGTLRIAGHDALGYNNSGAMTNATIIAQGTDGNLAKIVIADATGMTFGQKFQLRGHTEISGDSAVSGTNFNSFYGSVVATGTDNTISANIQLRKAFTVEVTNDGDELEISGVLSKHSTGNNGLTKTGAGTLILSGSNTYDCATTISAGTLVAANASALGTGAVTAEGSDGVNEVTLRIAQDSSGNALTIRNAISVSSGKTLILESSNAENKLSGVISGDGALKKADAGTLTLSGHNMYSSGTTIEGGVLKVDSLGYGNKGNLGTKFTQDGTVLKDGGVLEVTAAQNANSGNEYRDGGALRGFSVTSGEGTYRYSGSGTSLISHNASYDAQNQHIGIADGATLIFDVKQDTATLEVSKIIASNAVQASMSEALAETTGALKKIGAGTLTLSGANLYSGGTTIEGGVLVAGHASALGTKGVEVKSGATLNLGTAAVTVAGLSGAGAVGLAEGTASSTLTVNGGGVFTGTLASVSLVKQGSDSTLELSNTGSIISSAVVESGTLKFSPGISDMDTSWVSVGTVSVSDGAKLEIAPNSSAAVSYGLYATSGVTFAAGSKLVVDLTGAAPDVALSIITSSAIKYNTGTEDLTLRAGNLDDFVKDFVTLKGWDGLAAWSYTDNTLSVTLTVPEPSAFGLLAGAGALALVAARRRRTKRA